MNEEQGKQHGVSLRNLAERVARELRMHSGMESSIERLDLAALIEELSVHQIELELQNEELHEAQLALMEARDRYAHLYEFAPVGYLSLDAAGMIVAANLTLATLLRVERGALVGQRFVDLVAADSQDQLHRHLLSIFSRPFKQICDLEMKLVRGKPLYVRLESIADDEDVEIRGCRTTVTEITQLQVARLALDELNDSLEAQVAARTQELRRVNERLEDEVRKHEASVARLARVNEFGRALFDTARTIVLVLDKQARIVYFNRYFEELFGYSLDEVRGKDWFSIFIPARDGGWLKDLFDHASAGIRTRGNVNPVVTREGEEREIEWHDAELKTPDGEAIGLLCTGQDVTERKTLQESLLNIAEQEQRRIGQQLHDDLGQDIAALKLNMDMMLEGLETEDSAELQRGLRVASGLSTALQKVRQLAHGLIPYGVKAGDFGAELQSLVIAFSAVDSSCECDSLCVPGDDRIATQLYNIAREALTNAIKHGRHGDLKVRISCRIIDGKYVLSIADNGPGIKEEDWHAGGSGLHIMRYRAELIGAVLSVESPIEGGTVVRCTLPVR